jgi:hypothetical protein
MSDSIWLAAIGSVSTLVAGIGAVVLTNRANQQLRSQQTRVRQRAAAIAILQDLHRIQADLQPRTYVPGLYPSIDAKRDYATIHRWVEPLIVELSGRVPDVVGHFIRFEQLLNDHKRVVKSLAEPFGFVEGTKRNLADFEEKAGLFPIREQSAPDYPALVVQERGRLAAFEAQYTEGLRQWRSIDETTRELLVRIARDLRPVALDRISAIDAVSPPPPPPVIEGVAQAQPWIVA